MSPDPVRAPRSTSEPSRAGAHRRSHLARIVRGIAGRCTVPESAEVTATERAEIDAVLRRNPARPAADAALASPAALSARHLAD